MSDAKKNSSIGLKTNKKHSSDTSAMVLPNSLRLKTPNSANNRQSMSSILQRLPFIKQINATQSPTLKFEPSWLAWCMQIQKRHGSVALNLSQHASLSGINQQTMHISCDNTGAASLIKHQQSSLLDAFHNAGFNEISHIKVQMSLTKAAPLVKRSKPKKSQQIERPKPPESVLKSIEATQSLIENEQLAASLGRLAQTLKSSSD